MHFTLHSIALYILLSAGLTKCEKERKNALEMIENDVQDVVPPKCTETGAYENKQCYLPTSCMCVKPRNGKPKYKGFQFPRWEDFDCTSEYIFHFSPSLLSPSYVSKMEWVCTPTFCLRNNHQRCCLKPINHFKQSRCHICYPRSTKIHRFYISGQIFMTFQSVKIRWNC